MSTAEFGDPNLAPAPAPTPAPEVPLTPLTISAPAVAAPEPLLVAAPPAPAAQPVAPAPVEPPAQASAVPVQDMRDVPLGTLIFREGLLTEEQLQEALEDGMKRGKRLGEVLLERGLVSERDLGRLLAGQKGLTFVELDSAAIDPAAVALLPVEKSRLHSVLPIGFQNGLPVVAVADPTNDLVIENVRRALNCEPHLVVAGREALHRQIDAAYGAAPVVQPAAVEPPPVPAAPEPVEVAPPVVAQPAAAVEPPVLAAPLTVPPVAPPEPVAPPVVQPLLVEPAAPIPPVTEPVAPPAPAVEPPAPEPPAVEPLSISFTPVDAGAETPAEPHTPVEPLVVAEPLVVTPPLVAAEPAPAVEPEPVAVEPLTVEVPALVVEPVVMPVAPPVEPMPVAPEPSPDSEGAHAVVVRLSDGDRLELGAYHSAEEARAHAEQIVRQLSTEASWPFLQGRFIRPDAIVSVDLATPERSWLGSSTRRAAWQRESQS